MASPELPVPDGLTLRAFHGVRYAVDDISSVTSPPYDLISGPDARDLLGAHPNNVVRLILPGADHHGYGQARETLGAWLDTGVLRRDPAPAIYVYEQSNHVGASDTAPDTAHAPPPGTAPGAVARGGHGGGRVLQRGLIGEVALADPAARVVLPHEDVFPGPVADRLALMRTTQANLEPIFLLYAGAGGAATRFVDEVATSREPLVDVMVDDGIRHRLWAITDPAEIGRLDADLRPRQAMIADGHHRYATYRLLQQEHHAAGDGPGPWDYGLALLVDSNAYPPELKPIHRIIPALSLSEAVSRAKGSWQVHEYADLGGGLAALAEAGDPAFLLAGAGDACHLLTDPDMLQVNHAMPADRSARWRSLNTAVLAEFLLPKVWGLRDDEHAVRIVHHDPLAAVRLAREAGGTAVILHPLAVDDVLAIAAAGERVPRKSTSFSPKPRTGLLLRTFAAT